MKRLHVGAAAVNQTPLDWTGNKNNILKAVRDAKEQGVELLLLPELSITGYGCEDMFLSPDTTYTAYQILSEIAVECTDITAAVGIPFIYRNGLYNGAAVLCGGKIVGISGKQNLADSSVHYESRWFKPWPAGEKGEIRIGAESIPVGDLVFSCEGVKFGFEICEDAWVPGRPGASLSRIGTDIILNPSASHFSFQKNSVRRRFIIDGSRSFGVSYIYTNLLGNEAGRIIYDGASLIANAGILICESKRFSYRSMVLTSAVIDIALSQNIQRENQFTGTAEVQPHEIALPRSFTFTNLPVSKPSIGNELTKEEEFLRAVPLALFDYMRKSRSRGFVLSLSGGADSSAVASLVWFMVNQVLEELGPSLDGKLDYIPNLLTQSPMEMCHRLLTCIYQGTKNSSQTTYSAAKELAEAVGSEFHNWTIDTLVEQYTAMAEHSIGRKTAWDSDDIALQNIQARVRAPGVWMMANIKGALLVSTSNRSEAAVGYATMDGDTSGGISPLAGIDKHFLRHWLRWVEEEGMLPALHAVNVQQPTAELRPSETKQTDEEDLMPYSILNQIEQLAFRDRKYPHEIALILKEENPDADETQITAWVARFFRLWSRNQWKRERYAPSFHLDDTNLDPRSYLRFPILSGGFEYELKNLWHT